MNNCFLRILFSRFSSCLEILTAGWPKDRTRSFHMYISMLEKKFKQTYFLLFPCQKNKSFLEAFGINFVSASLLQNQENCSLCVFFFVFSCSFFLLYCWIISAFSVAGSLKWCFIIVQEVQAGRNPVSAYHELLSMLLFHKPKRKEMPLNLPNRRIYVFSPATHFECWVLPCLLSLYSISRTSP